jgi:tetratricopeptide (TPR) repeat protein
MKVACCVRRGEVGKVPAMATRQPPTLHCYKIEMERAMQRHEASIAQVLPIIVRPCDWTHTPFAQLQCLPSDGKPITTWENRDMAWSDVAAGIRRALDDLSLFGVSAPRATLSAVWNVPYPRNSFFMDRDDLLTHLRTQLQSGRPAALSQLQAVSGLGGIGKTQLAVEYAYRHRHEYEAVLWATADSREALISSYDTIATLLRLPEREAPQQDIVIQAVKRWLETHHNWLLILDNADDLDLLPPLLPPVIGGHLLLTTRAWDMRRRAERLEVMALPTEQGAMLLLRRAGLLVADAELSQAPAAEQTLALQLVREMGGLPLALEQAGAYLEVTGMSLEQYQQVYQQHLLQERQTRVPDHPEPVATTWSLSFARVEQKSPPAADLLRLCAFLAPDAIPEELLTQGKAHLGPVLSPVLGNPLGLAQAVETLRSASLMHRNPRTRLLSMHRLVQSVVGDALPTEVQRLWKQRAVFALSEVFPEVEFTTWPACERLLPHALQCATWIEHEQFETKEAVLLLHDTGYYLQERGRYQEAEPLFQHALRICERVLGPEHPWEGRILHELAILYQRQRKYAQAEPLFQRALHICEQALGPEHLSTASTLHAFASLYQNQGRYVEAERFYQRSLQIKEKILGEDPFTASTLHAIASLYQSQSKDLEAEQFYQRSLQIKEKALGPEHPSTGITLHALVSLYQNQGKYVKAEPLCQRTVHIFEKALGPESLWTASALQALASLYQNQGKDALAEPLFQRAQSIREQAVGSELPPMRTQRNPPAYLRTLKYEPKASTLEANTHPDRNI